MKLAEIMTLPCGVRYLVDKLELSAAASRGFVLEREMMTTREEMDDYRRRFDAVASADNMRVAAVLRGVKNAGHTLDRLSAGATLDDVELFELKRLAFLTAEMSAVVDAAVLGLPDASRAAEILDPDHTGVCSFHVYDSLDGELASLRRCYKDNPTPEKMAEIMAVEERVRARLTAALQPEAALLRKALQVLMEIDFMSAVVRQNAAEKMIMPAIGGRTSFRGLVNPVVRAQNNGAFQPVSLELSARPTVLVGANMGGKTVTLRSVAVAQLGLQFGFGVAAAEDTVMELFDEVRHVADESEQGYSSFGSEVRAIDRVIRSVAEGRRVLALIDEPARTTNPAEGCALVEALTEVCRSERSRLLVSTHYNLENVDCNRLKVKGLHDGRMNYEIIAVSSAQVPDEALAVAEHLGVDSRWIENAKKRIKKDDSNK